MRLKDKVILVTGSTTGIGEGMARIFVREGAKVMIHGRRKDAAQALAAELGAGTSFTIGALEDPAVPSRLSRKRLIILAGSMAWSIMPQPSYGETSRTQTQRYSTKPWPSI